MSKLNITPGEWKIVHEINVLSVNNEYVCSCGAQRGLMTPTEGMDMNVANAQLIAEAGTVYNETGMTPRELVEQNKELLNLLERAVQDHSEKFEEPHLDAWYNEAQDLIKKSEQS